MSESDNTWGNALKTHLVWFVLAIVIGIGGSYMGFRLNMAMLETNVAMAEQDISDLQRDLRREREIRSDLRVNLARLEEKINVLLIQEGIDPSNLGDTNRKDN